MKSPHLLSLTEGRTETIPHCLGRKASVTSSATTQTAYIQIQQVYPRGNISEIHPHEEKNTNSTDCFESIRIFPLQQQKKNQTKISFVTGGVMVQSRHWELDSKSAILFLVYNKTASVNHSNTHVKDFPFWNFSLPADNLIISAGRPHLHFFEPNNRKDDEPHLALHAEGICVYCLDITVH